MPQKCQCEYYIIKFLYLSISSLIVWCNFPRCTDLNPLAAAATKATCESNKVPVDVVATDLVSKIYLKNSYVHTHVYFFILLIYAGIILIEKNISPVL